MKKLLSLLLAAALALSLGFSALAYEDTDPPQWKEFGYGSLEEMLADWEMTEEEYAELAEDAAAGQAEYEAWIASYDAEAHEFDPALWSWYGYDSKAELLEAWEISEADYAAFVDEELLDYERSGWTDAQWDAYWNELEAGRVAAQKEALGLAYDVSVMVNGEAVDFGEAAPELVNGRTMIPVNAPDKAGETRYDAETGTVTVARGGVTLAFTAGGDRLAVTKNGETEEIALDVVPYLRDGTVYVPLRAAAEALGYDVLWSDTYRTAVLLDKAGIVEEIDGKFTVLNAAMTLGSGLDLSQTYSGEGVMDLKVTMYDSIGGDKTYSGSVRANVVQNRSRAYGKVAYDINDLLGLLLSLTGESADDEDSRAVLAALDGGLEMLADMDGGAIYLRGPVLAAAFGAGGENWLKLDFSDMAGLGGFDLAELTALAQSGGLTLGEVCYRMSIAAADIYDTADTAPVYAYEAIMETAEAIALLSDGNFTKDGDTWTVALPLPGLTGAAEEAGTFAFGIVMDGGKAVAIRGSAEYDADLSALVPGGALRIVCDFEETALKAVISGSVDVKNVTKAEFHLTADTAPAPDAEVPAAPEDALDLGALLGMSLGVIGGADGPTAMFIG